ncbi:MAG: hypothetical protein E6Q67_02970 [Roseateles sp.]|nr:MAG: hypothetical protein E6Q67_02970 [Roseateles sp.]
MTTDSPGGLTKRPPAAADIELLSQPAIASQMPVRFDNGACWSSITGQCKSCGQDIPDDRFTGRLSRLVPSVVDVDAVGVCDSCTLLTRFRYRLHDDMHLSGLTDSGWAEWRHRRARPHLQDLLGRLPGWIRAWLSRAR